MFSGIYQTFVCFLISFGIVGIFWYCYWLEKEYIGIEDITHFYLTKLMIFILARGMFAISAIV